MKESFFPILLSPSAGLPLTGLTPSCFGQPIMPFPLIGLTPSCLRQPIMPFKDDLAILPLVLFMKIRKNKSHVK